MSSLPSKRAFLAANGLANGDRGRFSAEAEAFAAANPTLWAEAPKATPVPKAVKVPVVNPPKSAAPKVSRPSNVDPKVVRKWAEAEGLIPAGRRGRLPGEVVAKFLSTDGGQVAQRAPRPTPLLMPKRRRESSGYTVVGGNLIRQTICGNQDRGVHTVASCPCSTGPQAYGFLSKEHGAPLALTLDKPAL